jgi:D-glycero-D-manno-heptose 1,7-bisphosphate phosphatase
VSRDPVDLRKVRTVFLDRDGTINVKAPQGEYITSPVDLVLLPGAAEAVAGLNAAGIRTVLVTNQRWLSTRSADLASFAAIEQRLDQLLAAHGARLDAAYHCPHAANACDCRKPGTGMLLRAAREHNLDLTEAVMIGDSSTDVLAGRMAGMATVLLCARGADAGGADAVAEDLAAAVQLILVPRVSAHDTAGSGQSSRLETLDERPGQHRESEGEIVSKIPAGQASRLAQQPVEPFESAPLHRRRRSPDDTGGHRDAATAGQAPHTGQL